MVKEFLIDKLHSLQLGEDIESVDEEPHILMAMRLIGHKYMPEWEELKTPECKAWVLHHMDGLLDESFRRDDFVLAIEDWMKRAELSRGKKKGLAAKSHSKALEMMGELHSALTTEPADVLEGMRVKATEYAKNCQQVFFIDESNANPSGLVNDRIVMKFLDYIWSPLAQEDRQKLGEVVLRHRLERMTKLGYPEAEDEARAKVSNC
jgi:hypothetical protein